MEYPAISTTLSQNEKLQQYYRFQSRIYDLTRWAFLFGRSKVLNKIPLLADDVNYILEVGCGTGRNLIKLAEKYPKAIIIGIDISEDMVEIASEATRMYPNIQVIRTAFPPDAVGKFDIVLMSYVLTMMNPGWEFWITAVNSLLKPRGYFAVVDFHNSPFQWFKNHMKGHHVKMEGHVMEGLRSNFKHFDYAIEKAYFGCWSYFTFVGKSK